VGFRPGRLPNPDLRWEKTGQFDIGLEFTALHNRLSGSIDYYRANTSDLIMDRQLPPTTGYSSILENVGATRNTGVEVALSTLLVQDWHGMPLERGVQRRREPKPDRPSVERPAERPRQQVVRRLSNLRCVRLPVRRHLADPGLRFRRGTAVRPAPWPDPRGRPERRREDRPGRPHHPRHHLPQRDDEHDHRVDWKGLDLSVMAVARLGFLVQDSLRSGGQSTLAGRYNNISVDYWTPTNPSNTEPRPNAAQENPDYGGIRGYQDGSFIKVRTITLGYTLPSRIVRPVARPVGAHLRHRVGPVHVHAVHWPGPRIRLERGRAELPDPDGGHHPGHIRNTAMRKHPVALLSAALLAGLPACVNLNEDVVTG